MGVQSRSPFTLKVGQLMTGFGAGCGIGVGVGYPIALGSIPVLGEMMSATSSAGSRAFGGVGQKAFGMLRKLGIKNLKAGVGCGVGIGHGFGVGIALKPGVSQQVVHSLQERLSAAATQLQKYLPSAETDTQTAPENSRPASLDGSTPRERFAGTEVVAEAPDKSTAPIESDASSVARVSSRGKGEEVEELRQENEILRTLLRHQELIEDLKGQNAAILRVLSEQFDMQIGGQGTDPASNPDSTPSQRVPRKHGTLHSFHSEARNSNKKCFECRVSARRRR